MIATRRFAKLASAIMLLVAIGCSETSKPDTENKPDTEKQPMDEKRNSPWTTIGEYDAGIVTSKPSGDDGTTEFVASKHFLGTMLQYICRHYDCTVIVDPPALASKPIELTVTGDSAESVFRAIADTCDLQFSSKDSGEFILTGENASGGSGRLIAADTFPPWWDQ